MWSYVGKKTNPRWLWHPVYPLKIRASFMGNRRVVTSNRILNKPRNTATKNNGQASLRNLCCVMSQWCCYRHRMLATKNKAEASYNTDYSSCITDYDKFASALFFKPYLPRPLFFKLYLPCPYFQRGKCMARHRHKDSTGVSLCFWKAKRLCMPPASRITKPIWDQQILYRWMGS